MAMVLGSIPAHAHSRAIRGVHESGGRSLLSWHTIVPSDDPNSLRRWVAGIAWNVVAMYHRRDRTRRRNQARYEQEEDAPIVPSHEGRVVAAFMLDLLESSTTAELWDVLLDATEGNLSAREIGESWGVPTTTIA